MAPPTFSIRDEIKTCSDERIHVVLLGAGASLAAFPNGDRHSRKLPLIKNFVDVIGLKQLLLDHKISPPYDDFEAVYSDIAAEPSKAKLQKEIEKRVYDYFAALELPDIPTLYDHLILSLRTKDVVATFNWDPFLWQAAARNYNFGKAPTLLFLHGNVAIAYCKICKTTFDKNCDCPQCGRQGTVSPLLYPVRHKDYQSDPAIAAHWRTLTRALKVAWAITFFGYSAPKTDVEAVKLLKDAWGNVKNRNLEETEIIDIRPEDDLMNTWSPFIHTHHFMIRKSFYDSYLGKHPRRSCEALWARLMECRFTEGDDIPVSGGFANLYAWMRPRIEAECGR